MLLIKLIGALRKFARRYECLQQLSFRETEKVFQKDKLNCNVILSALCMILYISKLWTQKECTVKLLLYLLETL